MLVEKRRCFKWLGLFNFLYSTPFYLTSAYVFRVAFEEIFIPSETNAKLIEKAEQILIDENGNRIDYIGIHVRR